MTDVVVVYKCFISSVMLSLGIIKHFYIERFPLCYNLRNRPAASLNLSNYYLTLVRIVVGSHILWHSTYKCRSFVKTDLDNTRSVLTDLYKIPEHHEDNRYSVMQSNGNSFCGDVVLDRFNMAYREDSILDQKHE